MKVNKKNLLDAQTPSKDDEAKMKEILSRQNIQNAMKSPKIQKLFAVLRSDPSKAQKWVFS